MAMSEDQTKISPLPKACENCRTRKIRCNRANPCSNCSTSGIECRPPSRHTEQRPRMIVSNHYERQIERIHERLNGIEVALRSLSGSHPSSFSPHSHTSQTSDQHGTVPTPSHFEGDSSFQQQSLRASEVALSLNVKDNGNISNAMNSLKEVISDKGTSLVPSHDTHFTSPSERHPGPQMERLPSALVIKMVAKLKEKLPLYFYNYSFPTDGHLERLCQRAYFPTEPTSLGEQTSMYGLLGFMLREYLIFNDPITTEFDCQVFLDVCDKNFHLGIETYEVFAQPSFDNAFALMLACSKAQDSGKVVLCWSLASAAARQLQSLGYHREASLKNDTAIIAEKKRLLFWTVYSIEKNIALNLGRSSNFQDWDVDVKLFQVSTDPAVAPWNKGTIIFVELSRLQGQIYEQLYSVDASRKSHMARRSAVEDLVRKLDSTYGQFKHVDYTKAAYAEIYQMYYQAFDVIYYALLTLLHRAASSPDDGSEISSKCFEAAKMCLKNHLHYFPLYTAQGEAVATGYTNWILLYCSFTPFIVVFLHAIASTSLDDVKLLQDMTESLEPVESLSSVLHRLYEVCRVFSKVAEVVVAHQSQPQAGVSNSLGSYDQQTDSLFFPGFTAHHGFDPQHQLPDIFMQGSSMDLSGPNMDDMSAYFGNWVSSNQPQMDLFSLDFGGNV